MFKFGSALVVSMLVCASCLAANPMLPGGKWRVHDTKRPKPEVVEPGTPSTQQKTGRAPSDAIVLFDGTDLSEWRGGNWKIEDDYMTVSKGDLKTKKKFGSCQLHVEWAAPKMSEEEGQGRGNSGVFLMGRYEIQVLDCYENETYADGYAGAIYGQYPPLVNACREPGEWQTFDIIFEAPEFEDGELVEPAYATVLHNGVLVQNHVAFQGPTVWKKLARYSEHPSKLPLKLQEHGDPVRFRNIWIRPLE